MREAIESLELVQNLKEFDHWLLVNRPRLWVIRLPYLLVYTVVANLGAYLFIRALPLQLHHVGSIFPILWVIFLASLGAFIFWLTRFNRHSAARAFENTSAFKGLVDFLIYLGCILVMLSPSITASFALTGRFDGMISLAELHEDARLIELELYPNELVEKYTGLDTAARGGLGNWEVNSMVRDNLYRLKAINKNTFEDLWIFFFLHLIVSHFALVMFAVKHTGRNTHYRALAYGVGLFILLIIYMLFLDFLWESPTFLGRLIDDWNDVDKIWLWGYCVLLVIIELIACSVFWQKRYRDFVAMNITLLPVGVYFFFIIEIMVYIHDHRIYWNISYMEKTQLELLILSPLIYLWLIPVVKAMYLRLLSLPRQG